MTALLFELRYDVLFSAGVHLSIYVIKQHINIYDI